MANMTTSIIMELVDRVTRPVRRIQQALSGLGRRAGLDRLAGAARRAGNAMGNVVGQARALGERFLVMGGLAAGAVWGTERLVSGVTDVGTAVQVSAERLRMGTTWLQEWQYVGRQFNVDNDALVDGLKELGLRADEFVMTAGGPAAEAFGRLGIGLEDLRATGGDTAEMFDLVRSRMGRLENDAARQRVMDEIFGGQGAEQMVEMLSRSREELEALVQQGRERGAILTPEEVEDSREYTNQMGDLRQTLFGIQVAVVGELLPAINEWIERMGLLGRANREAVASDIIDGIRQIWGGLQTVGSVISWLAEQVGGYGDLLLMLAGILSVKLAASVAIAVASLWKLGVALLATPIGWFLGAIALIAGAAYLIYSNWDGIVAWFGDLWKSIKEFFSQGIGDIVKDLLSFHPATLLLRAVDAVFEMFGARPLSEIGSEWIGGLVEGVSEKWDALSTYVDGRITALGEFFSEFSLSEVGSEWVGGLKAGISNQWDGLTGWLSGKIEGLTDWMPDWAKEGLGIETAAAPQPSGAPVATERGGAMALHQGRTDVGGELRIVLDSEGRPRVAETRQNGGMDFSVESGMHGVMP